VQGLVKRTIANKIPKSVNYEAAFIVPFVGPVAKHKWIFFFAFVCLVASCTSTGKMLQHTWKIADAEVTDTTGRFTAAQTEMIAQSMEKTVVFSFLPDSVYKVVSSGETHTGKWWIAKGNKVKEFYGIGPDGKRVIWKLNQLNKTTLNGEVKDKKALKAKTIRDYFYNFEKYLKFSFPKNIFSQAIFGVVILN